MKVIFMRHGEGVDDVEDRYGGWGDLPLSGKGKKQAEDSVNKLKRFKIEKVLASPLKRALETAEVVANSLNVEMEKFLYLKERNTYGLMSGERKDYVKKNYPDLFEAYEKDQYILGSERYEDLLLRLERMVQELKKLKSKVVLAVTHGKLLAAFVREYLGESLDKKDDCCLLEVEIKGNKVEFISADGLSFK